MSLSNRHYHARSELLQAHHVKQVVKMFTKAFCNSEPMTKYVGMEYDAFTPFAEMVTIKAVTDGLSSVVLEDDRVVACALVEDVTNPLNIVTPLTSKFDPIFNLLEKLSSDFIGNKKFSSGQLAHLFITAVDEDFRGKRLSEVVNFGAMEIARQKQFSMMFSELTNYLNEEGIMHHLMADKLLIGSIVYKEFVFNNANPFANLDGAAHSFIWSLDPNKKLSLLLNAK